MSDSTSTTVSSKRRRLRWALGISLGVFLLIAAGPTLLAQTSFNEYLVQLIFQELQAKVHVEKVSFGWITPIELSGFKMEDRQGRVMLEAKSFRIERTLWQWMWHPLNLEALTLDTPVVYVEHDKKTSNLQTVFGPWIEPKPEQIRPEIALNQVQIANGQIHVHDAETHWKAQVAQGQLLLHLSADRPPSVTFELSGEVTLLEPKPGQFYEQPLFVKCTGRTDPAKQAVYLTQLQIKPQRGPAAVEVQGELTDIHTKRQLALQGALTYDLPQLAESLRPYIGGNLQLQGQETKPFSISGSLADELLPTHPTQPADPIALIRSMQAQAEVSWTSAQCYGVQVGPATFQGRLEQGWLTLAMREVQVSEGKLNLQTRLELGVAEPWLLVEPGTAIDRLRLTPEICAEGLMYITPVLAHAAEVEGSFSLDFTRCELPLFDGGQPKLEGTLVIHQVDVGASSLAKQLAELLKLPTGVRVIDASHIHYVLIENRMHHTGLVFQLGPAKISSSGSVGLDQTLDLIVEAPIPSHWLGTGAIAQQLEGKTIRIPVKGTLKAPYLDLQALPDANILLLSGPGGKLLRSFLSPDGPSWEAGGELLFDWLKRRAGGETPILDLFRKPEKEE